MEYCLVYRALVFLLSSSSAWATCLVEWLLLSWEIVLTVIWLNSSSYFLFFSKKWFLSLAWMIDSEASFRFTQEFFELVPLLRLGPFSPENVCINLGVYMSCRTVLTTPTSAPSSVSSISSMASSGTRLRCFSVDRFSDYVLKRSIWQVLIEEVFSLLENFILSSKVWFL